MRNELIEYRSSKRYQILSDAMRVLLELVVVNTKKSSKSLAPKKNKVYLSYSEMCEKMSGILSDEDISIAIDYLFDRQEISAKSIMKDRKWVRVYAPATEMVQEAMTDLFILTPLERF